MKSSIALTLVLIAVIPLSAPGLDVYFMRHAETMGNVTHNYTDENQNTFSPFGLTQVEAVPGKLEDLSFDAILVSPTWRTQRTIAPYLKKHNLQAELWPEVEECDCGLKGEFTQVDVPRGEEIRIQEDLTGLLQFRDEDSRFHYAPGNREEGLSVLAKACEMIRSRFGGSDNTILVVSHSCTSSRLIEILLGLEPRGRFSPGNTALIRLTQQDDGSFRMLTFNEKPFQQDHYWNLAGNHSPVPEQPVRLSLLPRYFVEPYEGELLVNWQVFGENGDLLEDGRQLFAPPAAGASEVCVLEVSGRDAKRGEKRTARIDVAWPDGRVETEEFAFIFPSHHSLAGNWRIKAGDDESWALIDFDESDWLVSAVPGNWENDALPDYDGTAWYRLRFSVPDHTLTDWNGKALAVALGAIDDADETFLNGVCIGRSGEFPPAKKTAWDRLRVYPFDASLLREENVLAVRVSDWKAGGGIWRSPTAIGPAQEFK